MSSYLDGMDLPLSDSEPDEGPDDSTSDGFFCYRAVRLKDGASGRAIARFVFTVSDFPGKELIQMLHLPFKVPEDADNLKVVKTWLFNIGLVLLVWPWMYFGYRQVRIFAGALSAEQIEWWRWFYRNVLAEWAVVNHLSLNDLDLNLVVDTADISEAPKPHVISLNSADDLAKPRVLCPLGGGKDSLVVFELLQHQPIKEVAWLYVGDGVGEFENSLRLKGLVERSGASCHVVEHEFGQRQIVEICAKTHVATKLKPAGHPWAALVSFDAALIANALGFGFVAVGNERSANFGNGIYLERSPGLDDRLEVNHQFDKSFAFEEAFHGYIQQHLFTNVHHFSALQVLWELQITRVFVTRSEKYFSTFISCNNSDGGRKWCLVCEKCCFVFAILSAFLDPATLANVFGKNLLDDMSLLPRFKELLGIQGNFEDCEGLGLKPFECVGEPEETLLALTLARARWATGNHIPANLQSLASELDKCESSEARRLLGSGPAQQEWISTKNERQHLYPKWWLWPKEIIADLAEEALRSQAVLTEVRAR